MRRVFFFIVLSFLVSLSGLSAQTNQATLHLKGKVLDTTLGAMAGATVKVYRGTAEPKEGTAPTKEGVTSAVGDFDIELPAGDYRIEVTAPDFNTFKQAVKLAADTPPLAVTLSVKEFETVIDVQADSNEVGVDTDSSLTTDVIVGDALLDLPDNEEDLLAYLTELAAARGIVDGDLNIRVDGFDANTSVLGGLPNRNEIQEIRIVNSSFSADSSSSGPRIEIVTRPGTGNWTGRVGFTFRDEALNAAAPLTGRKPAQQQRNFTANVGGPLIPGRLTATFNVQNNQSESEGSAVRAVGINGPVNEGVANLSNSRNISFRPTMTLSKVHSLVGNFSYSDSRNDNSGIGTYTLPERATNGRGHNWSLQMSERATISARLTNEFRFQVRQNNSNTAPVTVGRAINVTQSFQSGGAPNRSQSRSQDFLIGNNFRWQTTRSLTLQGSLQVDHHNSLNNSQNNYLGTYSFSSLHDYCYAEALAHGGTFTGSECLKTQDLLNAAGGGTAFIPGTTIAITGIPTQFSITSGDPILQVSQSELTAFLQGEWRMNPRAQLSFGARYQMQEHLKDYNNIAPTVGLSYQLSRKQNWQTVVRAGGRMSYSTFGMGTWEQLLRNDGFSRQFSTVVTSPSYPNPNLPTVASNQVALANSIRVRAGDYQSPYTIQPSMSIDQSLPKGHRLSFNFQISRGLHQNRNRNINAPYPGTPLDAALITQLNSRNTAERDAARALVDQLRPYFPLVSNITQQESSGSSLTKNFSLQYRTQNKTILWNKVQIGGTVSWNMNWANDDNGTPLNPYDIDSEWGRSSNDQRHRITGSLNLRVPWNMQFTFQQLGWSSGRPYSITTGRDENGDTSNNDRAPGYVKNSETGPSTFGAINMNFTKTFSFGARPTPRPSNDYAEPQRGGGGFGGGGGGGFGGGGGQRGNQGSRQIQFTMQVRNLFNSTIRQGINGNLSSPLFGQITGGGQGRSITLGLQTNLGRLF